VFQINVYGPVPPVTAAVTDPFAFPQLASDEEVLMFKPAGLVTEVLAVAKHPEASVTVKVKVPAATAASVAPV